MVALFIRGKNSNDRKWNKVYYDITSSDHDPETEQKLSKVEVSCEIETALSAENQKKELGRICDQFEVGIIGNLEYDMYDIAVMLTGMPD